MKFTCMISFFNQSAEDSKCMGESIGTKLTYLFVHVKEMIRFYLSDVELILAGLVNTVLS